MAITEAEALEKLNEAKNIWDGITPGITPGNNTPNNTPEDESPLLRLKI